MAYKHGVYGSEIPTSLVPTTTIDSAIPFVVGTAPIHLASDPAGANKPIICYNYSEAVKQLGYSDDWANYTLCEMIYSHFALYSMAPVVFVNVLDIAKHKEAVEDKEIVITDGKASITDAVILSTLKLTSGDTVFIADTDYTAAYNDDETVIITGISSTFTSSATVIAQYDKVDPSKVTKADIIGGVSTTTGESTGLELVEEVYPRFGIIPAFILTPGYSQDSEVAAVMKSKATCINDRFEAIALVDIDDTTIDNYTKVPAHKTQKNLVDPYMILSWPKVGLGEKVYHSSVQLAGVFAKTDSAHGDVPYWPQSNESAQIDSCLANGKEVFLSLTSANYLNGQGVVTVLNEGGWKIWGNRTSVYPSSTDVKDAFIPVRRMFNWINNTLITTFWQKIDNALNKRLINTIVDSANDWLNGLTAKGYILGGKVEFRESDNTTTGLMDGKIYFHVLVTPCSPAEMIEFIQEYDTDNVSTLFD